MDWLLDPFSFDFMRRALLGGSLSVVATSVIGTWVVVRGLSFIGDALAHGVLPGIALAFIWGYDLQLGALVSALVMAAAIGGVNRRVRLPEDTGIGLLFVGMLALGVIIISRSTSYAGDLTSFLFGDVLGVQADDLRLQAVAAAFVVVAVTMLHRPFLALAFDEETAATLGLRPRWAHLAMLALVAVAIVSSFQAVGTLLVFGLLVAPPATASLLVRRVPAMMATSVAVGIVGVVAGLLVSFHFDTAASATMAGMSVAIFFVTLAGRELLDAVRHRSVPPRVPVG
ncbi:MAG TPA: zinc ABC transporter permease AztB [Acidimicrobiales bacterium]|nr:zinc ABC transporter permease AztB [Acidimicrobiales bacterium]